MLVSFRKMMLMLWWFAVPMALFSAANSESKILAGPVLKFQEQNTNGHIWKVTALYVLPEADHHPLLWVSKMNGQTWASEGYVIGKKYGHHIVRYSGMIEQTGMEQKVQYSLLGDPQRNEFVVPAIDQASNKLYFSCNGYQTLADKEKVGGIGNMFRRILGLHLDAPFHFYASGGDLIYIDGGEMDSSEPNVGKTFGIFALKTLQPWLADKVNLTTAAFTKEMKEEVDHFFFTQYVKHYNEPGFKEFLASVPGIFQLDDHDHFDGCGSYPESLQLSPVMQGIRKIAEWYGKVFQHQLSREEFPRPRLSGPVGYHYMNVIDDGRAAILGIDTRTERRIDRVLSAESWDMVFDMIENLPATVERLAIMLAVPVVYTNLEEMGKLGVLGKWFYGNIFGTACETDDDLGDHWLHKNHIAETKKMIAGLQEVAAKKQLRIEFLSGDVHLGGFGKIYDKECGLDDCSAKAMMAYISSPVGNAPAPTMLAKTIGKFGLCQQEACEGSAMCLGKIPCDERKQPTLIAQRNILIFGGIGSDFSVKLLAEPSPDPEPASPDTPFIVYDLPTLPSLR
jgi:hypothetical protein